MQILYKILLVSLFFFIGNLTVQAQVEADELEELEQDSLDAWLFYWSARIDDAMKKEDMELADYYWRKLTEADSMNWQLHDQRISFLLLNQDYEDALLVADRLVVISPEAYQSYWRRSEVHFYLDDYNSCLFDINQALSLVNNEYDEYGLLLDRATCKEYKEDFNGALRDYERIVDDYDSTDVSVWNRIGYIHYWNDDLDEAEKVLNLSKSYPTVVIEYRIETNIILSTVYLEQGKTSKARKLIEADIAYYGDDMHYTSLAQYLRNYALCDIYEQKNWGTSKKNIRWSIQMNPYDPYAYYVYALWYAEKTKGRNKKQICRYLDLAEDYEAYYNRDDVTRMLEEYCD